MHAQKYLYVPLFVTASLSENKDCKHAEQRHSMTSLHFMRDTALRCTTRTHTYTHKHRIRERKKSDAFHFHRRHPRSIPSDFLCLCRASAAVYQDRAQRRFQQGLSWSGAPMQELEGVLRPGVLYGSLPLIQTRFL